MPDIIHYLIQPLPEKHLFDVQCTIECPHPMGQKFSLPAWIPGSYLVRDFARHIVHIRAESNGSPVSIEMLDKNTWIAAPVKGTLKLYYQVYAYDLTPRGAHVDNTHAFFNGSRVFLRISDQEEKICELQIVPPLKQTFLKWRVGTSMPEVKIGSDRFGIYRAQNYEDLIDYPVEMGVFEILNFEVCGTPHELIISGRHKGDLQRLCQDLAKICQHHIEFFGLPAPMKKYVFLLTVLAEGYGGLEHRSSTAVHCRRDCLPKIGELGVSESYRTLLGLLSHEYFHTWLVKRIKPAAFTPYDLNQENYTRQLWIFEGITSYYDELALLRTHLITQESYFELLGQLISRVYSTPGRLKQTLEQASFEAWTKFYQPDENSPNATISYYTKGAIVALALDLLLRQKTQNQSSLDEVMRALWQRYGLSEQGMSENSFEQLTMEISGINVKDFFDKALRSTQDIALDPLFEAVGITLNTFPVRSFEELGTKPPVESEYNPNRPLLEVKLKPNTNEAQLAYVVEGGAAEAAGLAPHDVIIAINGMKVDRNRLETVISQHATGEEVIIHAFRRDELMNFQVKLNSGWLLSRYLTPNRSLSEEQKRMQAAWLGV